MTHIRNNLFKELELIKSVDEVVITWKYGVFSDCFGLKTDRCQWKVVEFVRLFFYVEKY